ncbi:hypothetical protein PGT21_024091 [Puccinia graminis f. sp. tritici]|uniref:Uncharacterized protein n=1 Tax=Puccinia graminis f. sp. tritici TaxID=56615 RepID=A0A5B0MFQ2_PUCGR|nr:hypothetical protein PGT21_024091 [Puccinia graminis f. sp. tritici]
MKVGRVDLEVTRDPSGLGVGSGLYRIALQERCGAPHRIACIGFFDTVYQYRIGKAMHHNLVASVCIAFQYDADAMQCIAFWMQYRYMAIYRIALHRFTVDLTQPECDPLDYRVGFRQQVLISGRPKNPTTDPLKGSQGLW